MDKKNIFRILGEIALEYRVSLKNLCKLVGKDPTQENMMTMYNEIISHYALGDDVFKFKYLFNFETVNEPELISKVSFHKAHIFLTKYLEYTKTNQKEQLGELLEELKKTEKNFDDFLLRREKGTDKYTEEDIKIISKYRIKNVVSYQKIQDDLNLSTSNLIRRQKGLQDEKILNYKLDCLNDFFQSLYSVKHKSKC